MIKFDKIKLLSKAGYISNIDCEKFVRCCKGDIQGEILNEKYQQKLPFYLLIMVDYQHDELVLEFTGKILLDKYTDLINRDTAKDCLEKINGLKICRLDVDSIMTDSEVSKCDVTKDIECNRMQDIITNVRQNLSNYKRWVTKPYGKKGITIENVAKTSRNKKRLIIYDKAQEMRLADNRDFLNAASNKDEMLSYFDNKIRFELNINTKYQIRKLLDIPNNSLLAVLESKANPILTVIDMAIKNDDYQLRAAMTLRDYEHSLLIKECDYDMSAIEAKVRFFSAKTTSITKAMEPYRKLCKWMEDSTDTLDIRALVA